MKIEVTYPNMSQGAAFGRCDGNGVGSIQDTAITNRIEQAVSRKHNPCYFLWKAGGCGSHKTLHIPHCCLWSGPKAMSVGQCEAHVNRGIETTHVFPDSLV